MYDEGARSLIAAILREALEEYHDNLIKLYESERDLQRLDKFFDSEWCYWLSSSIGIDIDKAVEMVVEISEQQTKRR